MEQAPSGIKNVTSYQVIYGDTDRMGVVYYANYLRWFEKGRTEFLRQMGIPYSQIEANGLHFPVTEVSCRYFRPARYDETITIETRLTSVGRATLAFSYRLLNATDLLATGFTKHACLDGNGLITKIPGDLGNRLKAAESTEMAAHPHP